MEYNDVKRPSLKGHGTGQPESSQYAAVPPTLLPTILGHLGLGERQMIDSDQAVAALQDKQTHVRIAAVHSLGAHREVSSLQFLVHALRDPAWEVRATAVWAISSFGEQAPVESLIAAMADEDGAVRAAALRVLAGVRGHVPKDRLTSMLLDTDWQVHEAAVSTEEELREIEVLGDRYQLLDPIGKGGMATIYRGRDTQIDRVVAIKVLEDAYSTDPKFVARFQREAKAASVLQHPNIVQVYDYGQTDGNYYIVMELVEGTDLRRYLRSRGVLDVDRAVIIAHDVALGLGAAHRRRIVHRDVKPQNVLIGRGGSIKLTDFGIASVYKDISVERLTTTGMTLGTVQYYAPEQAQGEIVTPAADVYALGIVMYEMLTGHPPFDGDSLVAVAMQHIANPPIPPSQLNPQVPAALEEIILRCLEKVPERRFRDGSQLARALESLGDSELGEVIGRQRQVPVTYNQILPRPNTSGRGSARDGQQGDNPPTYAPDSGTPRLVQRGSVLRSGVVNQIQTGSRFFNSITLFILLATLLLLGFSIYLAVQLGFISLPFFNGGSTPQPGVTLLAVPDLKGKTWTDAQTTANADGFVLQSETGDTSGVVISQNPSPPAKGRKGDRIEVLMQVKKAIVPDFPKYISLAGVEQIHGIGDYW